MAMMDLFRMESRDMNVRGHFSKNQPSLYGLYGSKKQKPCGEAFGRVYVPTGMTGYDHSVSEQT